MDECSTWLLAVYQHKKSTNMDSLFAYFRGPAKKSADLTPAIRNMVSGIVKQVFPASSCSDPGGAAAMPEAVVDRAQCATNLYYTVAEHILCELFPCDAAQQQQQQQARSQRFKGLLKVAGSPECYELISHEEFHLPLLECALHLVAFVTSAPEQQDQHYPWVTHVLGREQQAAALWQAARDTQVCFGAGSRFPLPAALQQHLQSIQSRVLDEAAFKTGSIWFSLASNESCALNRGNKLLLRNILKAYAQQAVTRTQLVAWNLQQQQQQQQQQGSAPMPAAFHERCVWLLDQVLLRHLPIVFGQHMSVVVACVVYMTAKVLQASVTFNSVTEVMVRLFEGTSQETFQQAELAMASDGTNRRCGDVRAFYNDRFLPALQCNVRQYLQDYLSRQVIQASHTHPAGPAPAPVGAAGAAATSARDRVPLAALPNSFAAAQPAAASSKAGVLSKVAFKAAQQLGPAGPAGSECWSLPLLSGQELQPWQEAENAGSLPVVNATCASRLSGVTPQRQQQGSCTPVRQMR